VNWEKDTLKENDEVSLSYYFKKIRS